MTLNKNHLEPQAQLLIISQSFYQTETMTSIFAFTAQIYILHAPPSPILLNKLKHRSGLIWWFWKLLGATKLFLGIGTGHIGHGDILQKFPQIRGGVPQRNAAVLKIWFPRKIFNTPRYRTPLEQSPWLWPVGKGCSGCVPKVWWNNLRIGVFLWFLA